MDGEVELGAAVAAPADDPEVDPALGLTDPEVVGSFVAFIWVVSPAVGEDVELELDGAVAAEEPDDVGAFEALTTVLDDDGDPVVGVDDASPVSEPEPVPVVGTAVVVIAPLAPVAPVGVVLVEEPALVPPVSGSGATAVVGVTAGDPPIGTTGAGARTDAEWWG